MSLQESNNAEFFEATLRVRQACTHEFVVTNWIKTEKSENASQLMCRKCMMLMNMRDICEQHARFMGLLGSYIEAQKQAPATPDTETAPVER